MKITILCVGKIKETYFSGAIKEYSKRLSRYCKISCRFIKKEKEWEKLLTEAETAGDACLVLPGPDSVSSEDFSAAIGRMELSGQGKKRFFIKGGRFGLLINVNLVFHYFTKINS